MFGIRQSGVMDFQLGDVYQDAEILKKAQEAANELLNQDPQLESETYAALRAAVEKVKEKANLETTL